MRLFSKEMKKLFINNYGLIIFAVLIAVQAVSFNITPKRYNYETEKYSAEYQQYLKTFGGKADEQKQAALKAEDKRLRAAEEESYTAFSLLYNGEISPSEYDAKLKNFENISAQKAAFKQIESQFNYAIQDAEHRYIMYENGWSTALNETGFNFLLILCVIVLVSRIFSPEYESDMYALVAVTKNGNKKTAHAKIFVSLFCALSAGFASALVVLVSSQIKFGLSSPDYPIQSLSSFSSCQYNLTVGQTFACIWALKTLALCLIAVITALCCTAVRKNISALFTACAVSILPYFVFDLKTTLGYIPFIGLSMSHYYFTGINESSDVNEVTSVPVETLLTACAVSVALIVVCAVLTSLIWSRKINIERRKKK